MPEMPSFSRNTKTGDETAAETGTAGAVPNQADAIPDFTTSSSSADPSSEYPHAPTIAAAPFPPATNGTQAPAQAQAQAQTQAASSLPSAPGVGASTTSVDNAAKKNNKKKDKKNNNKKKDTATAPTAVGSAAENETDSDQPPIVDSESESPVVTVIAGSVEPDPDPSAFSLTENDEGDEGDD
jgi:hypothetical protein